MDVRCSCDQGGREKEEKDCLVTWRLLSHTMKQGATPQWADGVAAAACTHSPPPSPFLEIFLLIDYIVYTVFKEDPSITDRLYRSCKWEKHCKILIINIRVCLHKQNLLRKCRSLFWYKYLMLITRDYWVTSKVWILMCRFPALEFSVRCRRAVSESFDNFGAQLVGWPWGILEGHD